MISTTLVHKFSAFIFNEKHSFFYIYNSRYFVHFLITGVFFNSLHSVAREFSQNMDANANLNPRVGIYIRRCIGLLGKIWKANGL